MGLAPKRDKMSRIRYERGLWLVACSTAEVIMCAACHAIGKTRKSLSMQAWLLQQRTALRKQTWGWPV